MSQEDEAVTILRRAGAFVDGGRIRMPAGVQPKRVWRAFDYLMFECGYADTNNSPPFVHQSTVENASNLQ